MDRTRILGVTILLAVLALGGLLFVQWSGLTEGGVNAPSTPSTNDTETSVNETVETVSYDEPYFRNQSENLSRVPPEQIIPKAREGLDGHGLMWVEIKEPNQNIVYRDLSGGQLTGEAATDYEALVKMFKVYSVDGLNRTFIGLQNSSFEIKGKAPPQGEYNLILRTVSPEFAEGWEGSTRRFNQTSLRLFFNRNIRGGVVGFSRMPDDLLGLARE